MSKRNKIFWCIINKGHATKSLQSCLTLCDPIDGSPPGSPIPGILQARTLEWVAISFSNTWKWKVKVKSLCRARLLATPWTAAYQAPPSIKTKFGIPNLKTIFTIIEAAVGQSPSHVWFFVIPWTVTCQVSLSFTVSQSLLKNHVHRFSYAIQPSHNWSNHL